MPLSVLPPARVVFRALCLTAFVVLELPSRAAEPESSASKLQGIDLDGQLHRLGDDPETRAIVVAFLATECPISNAGVPELNRLWLATRRKGAEFYGVIASSATTRADAIKHRQEYALRFPVLFDSSAELRRRLQPTHTPEVFVLTADGQVKYRGQINDRFASVGRKRTEVHEEYLSDALTAVLNDRPVATPRTEPVGCLLEPLQADPGAVPVTYAREIAPILQAHCGSCHRPGGAAPFSLLEFDDARRHAAQIAEVTRDRLMPPWKPEANFGRFRHERRLSEYEIDLLDRWVQTGMTKGDTADLPAPPEPFGVWQLGKPDLILEMPADFEVPAEGNDIIQHFVLPTGLRENRMIAALEFHPGNPRVVHHACFFYDTTRTARKLDAQDSSFGYGGGGGPGFLPQGGFRCWVPGSQPLELPDGTGRPILRGTDLILEIHYQCVGKPERDRSSVGIYFAPRNTKQMVLELQVINSKLLIPAGEPRHHHRASYTLPVDSNLLDVAPHMHYLGREVKVTATRPDGTVEPLLLIRDWDFRWQGHYVFAKPVRLPKGTRIDVDVYYDNSADNPLNPHRPPKDVGWGEQTVDEMCLCYFHITCDRMSDALVLEKHMIGYLLKDAGLQRTARK